MLLSSKSVQMVDVEGARTRKVLGPARFLHNGTYLLCDTALWNVETQIIEAWGNVSILQEETVLSSDRLEYLIDQDLAKFRGTVVQLIDKDHNTLRTRHLDYNTKDSVAVFDNGASMRDKDGQIIESLKGSYDSKVKKLPFNLNVNMFTDSIFVKTNKLIYESDYNMATFSSATNVWQKDNMLSSQGGWYDRGKELFFFSDDVHLMSETQEGWSDSLFFYRNTSDVDMLGRAQLTDTTRNVYAVAGRIQYSGNDSKVIMTRKPAVISQIKTGDSDLDTVYLGASRLVYYTTPRYAIDSTFVLASNKRLESLTVDPVGNFRKKASEAAAKKAEEEKEKDPNYKARKAAADAKSKPTVKPAADSLAKPTVDQAADGGRQMSAVKDSLQQGDSLAVKDSLAVRDTLASLDSVALADSIPEARDTTKIGFLEAMGNVRVFKKDIQLVCDSLLYSDLDSLARMFKEPVVWQEVERQYAADSITISVSNGVMRKASLMSNAFITIEEDPQHHNQIRGTEMLAYFDKTGILERFDVLGGASALFFVEENEVLATVNKTESKMLSANFKDGELQRIYYYEAPKNDGFPVVQLKDEETKLKGYVWYPEKRPASPQDVTPLDFRPSERARYSARPRAKFVQTEIYFPGYISDINRQIAVRDSLQKIRERERELAERQAAEKARMDSIAVADSISLKDKLIQKQS